MQLRRTRFYDWGHRSIGNPTQPSGGELKGVPTVEEFEELRKSLDYATGTMIALAEELERRIALRHSYMFYLGHTPKNKKRHSGYSDRILAAVHATDDSAIATVVPHRRLDRAALTGGPRRGRRRASLRAAFPVASASGDATAPDALVDHPLFRRRPIVAGKGSGVLTTSSPEKHPASSGFELITLVAVVDTSATTTTTSLSSSSSSSSSSSTLSPERPPPAASGPPADDPAASPTDGAGPPRLPRRHPAHPALKSLRTAAPRAVSHTRKGSAHSASSVSAASAVSASFHAPPSLRALAAPPRPLRCGRDGGAYLIAYAIECCAERPPSRSPLSLP
ncbi:hypothetical protein HK405_015401, partial [Cladochytrium tenue]